MIKNSNKLIKILIAVSLLNLLECYNNGGLITQNSKIPSFKYTGCYNDKREERDISEKDFSFITKYNKSLPTVELCVSLCHSHGFKVAGVQA